MANDDKTIGARLKTAREYLRLSQLEVTESVEGLSRSALSLIESGQRKVSAKELRELAQIYGQPMSDFIGDAPQELPQEAAIVARQMTKLSTQDRAEVLRFTELLLSRNQQQGDS